MSFATTFAKYTLLLSTLVIVAAWYFAMPSIKTVRQQNEAARPPFSPVVVIVGGTSGIGHHISRKLAQYTTNPHLIISGRNRDAATAIIQELQQINPSAQSSYEFVPVDVTSMKNIKAYTAQLKQQLDKLNYLVLSPGMLTLAGRNETEEGIDKKMACHYYGRFLIINELMPLLQAAKDRGEDARVLTVLAAGHGGSFDLDDLDLKKNFGLSAAADSCTSYNDIMVEELSSRHPTISFTHAFPGFVDTPLLNSLPWYARWPAKLILPFSRSADTCGEFMVHPLLSPEQKQGWWMVNENAEIIKNRNKYATEEARKKVWEHSVELTENASKL